MDLSKKDYLRALEAKGVLNERRIKVLKAFGEFPNYRACGKDIGAVIAHQSSYVNLVLGHLSKAICKYFNITDPMEFNSTDWWPIIATGKKEKNGFYWTLREPFVDALIESGIFSKEDFFPDEADIENLRLMEGGVKQVTVNAYERNPEARAKCIQEHGVICKVCNIDFAKIYGERGKGFIHVHHVIKVSDRGREKYEINHVKDLQPVCPNCHAMLHRGKEMLSIEELRGIIKFRFP